MKLIVQIPCYNEEDTLPQTYADIPKEIPGVDKVEVLIIDDGSTDRTIAVARELGVNHIIVNRRNQGLARTFRVGLDACLKAGADIIVNTDGDNQYAGGDIPKLIEPILKGKADLVIGDRQTNKIAHFSPFKKKLQWLGSYVVRTLSETEVPDAVSGFRAISREAALRINIVSPFSYTIEMVIQAGKKQMAVTSVPISTNSKTRESRLFKSIPHFVQNQLATIVRMYAMYQPLRVFFLPWDGTVGYWYAARFTVFVFYAAGDGDGHIQSLVLGGAFLLMGFGSFMFGLVADLISFNRQLLEMTLERSRKLELSQEDERERKYDHL